LKIFKFTGLAPTDSQSYDYPGPNPSTPYYKRGKGKLSFNLGENQRDAFPSAPSFPRNPSGKQFGIFEDVTDNS
ncbi:MAG: hypothetical protein ACKO0V_02980, partial [bacterium]